MRHCFDNVLHATFYWENILESPWCPIQIQIQYILYLPELNLSKVWYIILSFLSKIKQRVEWMPLCISYYEDWGTSSHVPVCPILLRVTILATVRDVSYIVILSYAGTRHTGSSFNAAVRRIEIVACTQWAVSGTYQRMVLFPRFSKYLKLPETRVQWCLLVHAWTFAPWSLTHTKYEQTFNPSSYDLSNKVNF